MPAEDKGPGTPYEGFTMELAGFDTVPVLLFTVSGVLLGRRLGSPLFLAGVALCLAGGLSKCLWKMLIVWRRRDVVWLKPVSRIGKFGGFAVMAAALALGGYDARLLAAMVKAPALYFLIAGLAGLSGMVYCFIRLDRDSACSNWIEEGINTLAQLSWVLCVLMAMR